MHIHTHIPSTGTQAHTHTYTYYNMLIYSVSNITCYINLK